MNGSEKVISTLNALLKSEFQAIHQYTAESAQFTNDGYTVLAVVEMDRAKTEMEHAGKLMGRIALLGERPVVDDIDERAVPAGVQNNLESDATLETDAIELYKEGIAVCEEGEDPDTRVLLEGILADEVKHLQTIEAQQTQLDDMGKENFLSISV